MSGIDSGLYVALIGLLALIGALLVVKQLWPSDKSLGNNDKVLQEALRDLSANQQQIVGSIKVITDTQATSQAAIIKHVESRLEEIQNSISSSQCACLKNRGIVNYILRFNPLFNHAVLTEEDLATLSLDYFKNFNRLSHQ